MRRIRSDGEDPGEPAWVTERERFQPAALDWRVVLAETSDVVCYLDEVRVYPSGFRFHVHALLLPSAAGWARKVFTARHPRGEPEPNEEDGFIGSFLLGVEYEDGRRAAIGLGAHGRPGFAEGPDEFPILQSESSNFVPDAADHTAVLYGLPPKGPLTLHARWSALGVPETTAELDGDALRAAAARSVPLWPEGEPPLSPPSPRPPASPRRR